MSPAVLKMFSNFFLHLNPSVSVWVQGTLERCVLDRVALTVIYIPTVPLPSDNLEMRLGGENCTYSILRCLVCSTQPRDLNKTKTSNSKGFLFFLCLWSAHLSSCVADSFCATFSFLKVAKFYPVIWLPWLAPAFACLLSGAFRSAGLTWRGTVSLCFKSYYISL